MQRGQFVLKRKDKVIRVIRWETSKANVVYLKDARRIEILPSLADLDHQQVQYKILRLVSKEEVEHHPVKITDDITFEYVRESAAPVPVKDEDAEQLKRAFKYSLITHAVFIAMILILGYFHKETIKEEIEVEIVDAAPKVPEKVKQTVEMKTPVKVKEKFKVADKTRITKNKNHKIVGKPKIVVKSNLKHQGIKDPRAKAPVATGASIDKLGALGGLGASGMGVQGANLAKIGKGNGRGALNGNGQGLNHKALFGESLVNSAQGSGKSVGAYKKGYGTQGLGGGGSAAYGKHSVYSSQDGNSILETLEEEAIVQGGLDPSQVEAVIKRNLSQATYCYEKALQSNPNLEGRMDVKFVINGQGRVSSAQVKSSSLGEAKVENCIVSKLKSWGFPKPVGNVNVKVSYPFIMTRSGRG